MLVNYVPSIIDKANKKQPGQLECVYQRKTTCISFTRPTSTIRSTFQHIAHTLVTRKSPDRKTSFYSFIRKEIVSLFGGAWKSSSLVVCLYAKCVQNPNLRMLCKIRERQSQSREPIGSTQDPFGLVLGNRLECLNQLQRQGQPHSIEISVERNK